MIIKYLFLKMGKKKKPKKKKTVKRTLKILQNPGLNTHKIRVFRHLCLHSKNIYNSRLYCCRQWFRLWKLYIDYICDNIKTLIIKTTPNDRLLLSTNLYYNSSSTQNYDKLKIVIENSHSKEKLNDHFNTTYKTNILKHLTKI